MSIHVHSITFDAADPVALAAFWSAALDRPVADGASEWFAQLVPSRRTAGMMFIKAPDGDLPAGTVEKRPGQTIHLDLSAGGDERRPAEVERLIALGATKLWDAEQDGLRWVTLVDPEGNAFCVA